MLQGRIYREGRLTTETITLDALATLHGDNDAVYWLDLVKPDRADIDHIASTLGIDSTHADDAFNNVVDVGKVTAVFTVVKDLDRLARQYGFGALEQRHVSGRPQGP
jgi:hypothetical protein